MIEILGSVLGGLFFYLVPGMAWCLLVFRKERLEPLELICLSIALSISLSTLSIFFLNSWLGVKINLMNSAIILSLLTIIPLIIRSLINNKIDMHRSGNGRKDL